MEKLFLVKDGYVSLQKEDVIYYDTVENFKLDGADFPDDIQEIDYAPKLNQCAINGEFFKPYPNDFAEECLNNLETFIANRDKRFNPEVVESEDNNTNAQEMTAEE